MATKLGTAYVDVKPDLSSMGTALSSFFAGGKIGGLTKAAGAVGAVGAAAGVAAKQLYDVGAEFDAAFDKIRVQTGASEKQMARLEKSFKKVVSGVPTDFDSAAEAVGGLNQRLDLTGRPLARLSKQVLELSRITGTETSENVRSVTRLFGDWSVATKKQQDTLDGLYRVSQETGITVGELSDTLVQFGSPLRTLGLDFDFAASMVAKFEKEGVNMTTLMSGLRLSVANLSDPTDELGKKFKQFGIDAKEPADQIMQVMEAIKNTSSTMKGNQLAFEVFGRRAGSDMAAAIREGRFEVDDLMKTLEDGKGTIRDSGRDTMDLGEHWQKFSNRMKVLVEPAASAVFKALGDGMKILSKIDFQSVIDDLRDFWREAGVFRDVVTTVWRAVKDVMGAMFQSVKGAVKLIGGILKGDFGQIWDAVKDIFRAGVKLALAPIKGMISIVKSIGGRIGDALEGALGGAWDKVEGIFRTGLDVILTVVNAVLDVIEEIPGVGDLGPISNPLGGGTAETGNAGASGAEGGNTTGGNSGGGGNNKRAMTIPSRLGGHEEFHALGGKVTAPTAIVGEEAPAHPEFVIATNPAYRDRNKKLWAQAGHEIGIPGFAAGGVTGSGPIGGGLALLGEGAGHFIDKLPDVSKIPGVFGNLGDYIIDKATGFIKDKVSSAAESIAGGITGGMTSQGPGGIGSYGGLPMANWVIMALRYAAQKGASPQPTSGYRSHATNVAAGRTYFSEHEGTAYPHGAVDFGGYTTGLAEKMSVVNATRDFAMPLLAPIGFVDDGHASGTGHFRGGILGRAAGHALEFFAGGGQRGKGRTDESLGRSVPTALAKYNKIFPKHVSPDYGGYSMPPDHVAMLAEYFGMPGVAMAQIAHGESNYRPGAVGDDSAAGYGNTFGYGLWQITTGASGMDSQVARMGGYEHMLNPLKNAIIAREMWKARGTSPWLGTRYLTDPNAHWSGDFGDMTGRSGGGGSGGGGGQNGDRDRDRDRDEPEYDPLMSPWAQAAAARRDREKAAKAALRESDWFPVRKALPGRLGRLIESLDEVRVGSPDFLSDLDTKFSMPSSEEGRELSAAERENLVFWNQGYLTTLLDERNAISNAYQKVGRDSKAGVFLQTLMEEIAGSPVGGEGGEILQQRAVLDELLHPDDGTAAELAAQQAELLELSQAETATAIANLRILGAQMPVFADLFRRVPFGGSFAKGGPVPGPAGQPVGIIAHGGEHVVPEGGMNVTVVVEDGAVRPEAIRVVVNDTLANVARASSPVGGSAAQRVRR